MDLTKDDSYEEINTDHWMEKTHGMWRAGFCNRCSSDYLIRRCC
ncbi:MAG: hypothetical protein Q8R24_03690 [Legionellaceae bacterium]|nr:hypothetical protein [Legionellaceae bacterium]